MSFADLSRAVLRVQYQIARFPLQLVEEQLVARLDSDARLRLFTNARWERSTRSPATCWEAPGWRSTGRPRSSEATS